MAGLFSRTALLCFHLILHFYFTSFITICIIHNNFFRLSPDSTYRVNLKLVNDAWIWPESNLILPLGSDYWFPDFPVHSTDCGRLTTVLEGERGYLFSDLCSVYDEVLCTLKGKYFFLKSNDFRHMKLTLVIGELEQNIIKICDNTLDEFSTFIFIHI